jgi:predicted ATPase/class 3 adenylate cyclase
MKVHTETRALLLTDVVDSTKLSSRIGDEAMAAVWAAHDRVARDLLPRFNGREIDKTDGMLLMFDGAAQAVEYAHAYHRALAELHTPLRARAGLHVGPVILRENDPADVARGAKPLEVDGLAKPTAARVMSMARGGQTLLTPEALAALGASPPWRIVSHGHWVLKGIPDPVEVFEAGDERCTFDPPPEADKAHRVIRSGERWVPVSEIPNNLPPQRTTFIGREDELRRIKSLLDDTALVTLLGMGGLGKTRLSLQAARELLPRFPDGAWFIDLTAVKDPELVVSAAAHALDVYDEPGRPLIDSLCAWLKPRQLLLVLDNCEHLLEAAGDLVEAILRLAPKVRVLASSRELLDLPGEQAFPILPLPVPGRDDDPEALERSASVRLFVERARTQRPDFSLQSEEPGLLGDLVARLEGIPLAIELAAARLRTLGIADIRAGLENRYQLLTGGSRVLQRRQQTLRALVDWSYDLLDRTEQRLLGRLAVFAGGFDRAAATAVCADEAVAPGEMDRLLDSLVDKSLVLREDLAVGERHRMLETIRDYAREKLDEQGDEAEVAARHGQHFFALAKEAREGLKGADQPRWLHRMEAELDNLRATSDLAVAGGIDPLIAVKLAVALQAFWILRGHVSEWRHRLGAVMELPAVRSSDVARAWVLYTGAVLADSQGDHAEARRMLETCLEIRRGMGNPVEIAATLSTLSLARLQGGDPDGAAACEQEALEIFRRLDNRLGEALSLLHLGQVDLWRGDGESARRELERARDVAQQIANLEVEAESELAIGQACAILAEGEFARSHATRALEVSRAAADKRGEASATWWLGRLALDAGDLASARPQLDQALRAFQAHEMRPPMIACVEDQAWLAAQEDKPERGLELAAASEQARRRMLLARAPWEEERWRQRLPRLRAALPDVEADSAWARGRRWELDEAVKAALAAGRLPAEPASRPA